jgi:hypothetical protein
MDRVEHWFYVAWPILSPMFCFLLGSILTRWTLIPRYCPRCQMYLTWNEEKKVEAGKLAKEKADKNP